MDTRSIFVPEADFSGMSDEKALFVNSILQNTFISVNQYGTEAAAATSGALVFGCPPEEKIVITIDHPLLFAIVDKPTGVVLFLGKATNPV